MDNKEIFANYELYSNVFSYPNLMLKEQINKVQKLVYNNYNSASNIFDKFVDFVGDAEVNLWEEIYTRSFDVQALTTLDLGYVLFGDDYKRGELLVNLSNEHKKVNNNCGYELADHLPNVLRLLNKVEDNNLRADIISYLIYPAIKKIESEFDLKHIEKKSKIYRKLHRTILEQNKTYGLIYIYTIQTLLIMLSDDFPELTSDKLNENNFTDQISQELSIEKLG